MLMPMTYTIAFLIVFVSAATAPLLSYRLRRVMVLENRRRHHDVGNPIFLQLGLLFAVLLAFVYNDVQAGYNEAAEAINGEVGALHGAAMLAHALPDQSGKTLNQAILAYAESVINTEWPMMAERLRSPQTAEHLRAALDLAVQLPAATPAQAAAQAQILALLTTAHAKRETRIFQMTLSVPAIMWMVLIGNALVLIFFVLLAGVDSPAVQMLFASAFTGGTVSVLVLVRMLDFPFEGALALSGADFTKVAGEVTKLIGG
jgi:hypothetical protein